MSLRLHFVCTANICRSAYAERRAPTVLGTGFACSSSGVQARPGLAMDPQMAAQLRARGIDPTAHSSRRTGAADVRQAGLVLTMASWHRTLILEEWPDAVTRVFTLPQFVASARSTPFAELGTTHSDVIRAAYRHRVPARSVGDVADPYGQGPEAAAACGLTLDKLLIELGDLLTPPRPPRRSAD
ncbi:MAG: protein tyrosine phosphatase [Acidipropionibacterium acidipropionici]|jgi:protein-tyrosine phosphatase|uniref:arsenate reductase/protein-tyrosine-phosphatase family protein n=1 Tax=Acidipropionibacterium acidipropionici TaxID=1748 RepID=UPI002F354C34